MEQHTMKSRPLNTIANAAPQVDRRDVSSAWDKDFDPYYGDEPQGQVIDGRSFADARDEMNDRRRQTARRVNKSTYY
jgi:hypothetical protein